MGPLKILNGIKLILDDQGNHLDSYAISLESFRSFRGPLFRKPVTGQELFFAVSYSKPALVFLSYFGINIRFPARFFEKEDVTGVEHLKSEQKCSIILTSQACNSRRWREGAMAPQILADLLILSQPGGRLCPPH